MPNKPPQNYLGQTFNQPVRINGTIMMNPEITISRQPYLLERYDFDKLINGKSVFLNFANTLLGAVLGLFINMLAKFIGNKIDPGITFDDWEIYAFVIALIIMIIFYILHYSIPNERRRIIKDVKLHFENS